VTGVPHRSWQVKENRIINRFVRAQLNCAFRSTLEAARHCLTELDSLYRRSGRRGVRPRTFSTIYTHLKRRLSAAGAPLKGPVWTPAEDRVVMRFTPALFAGKYENACAAASACHAALLAERGPLPDPRPVAAWTAVGPVRPVSPVAGDAHAPLIRVHALHAPGCQPLDAGT
jgi:hypothetical protein